MAMISNTSGIYVKRQPNHGNQGLLMHNKKIDAEVDENASRMYLDDEQQGLKEIEPPKSVLTWHVTLQLDFYYTLFFTAFMTGIHFFKGYSGLLVYPPTIWGLELACILMFGFV